MENRSKKRDQLADRLVAVMNDNIDLFQVRFLTLSSSGVEWFEDVQALLIRFVKTSSALSDKEVFDTLLSVEKLSLLVRDELLGFGLDEQTASDVERLLRGVLAGLNCDTERKGGSCQDLVKWLYGSLQNSRSFNSLACVDISEADFKRMKQRSVQGTDRLLSTANAGAPNSIMSEAFSFELLSTLLGGRIELDKTELEIDYKEKGKITDYSFRTLDNVRIGVSVTRALGKDFDAGEADRLLKKKLVGVFESSRNVANKDGWEKQVLHVWCENRDIAATIQTCYSGLDDLLKQDTFVLLTTIVDGLVDEIFYASESSANLMRLGGVTINYVQGVFSKEVSRRPSYDQEPKLPASALACGKNHIFFGDQLGGLRCQICDFETKDRVWKCQKECGIALCGNCQDKWKKKVVK